MNLDSLIDLVSEANEEVGRYKLHFFLPPAKLTTESYPLPDLDWKSIEYGEEKEIKSIPDNKRGIYAFAICRESNVLPPHGYILYIGIAGKNSNAH